MFPRATMLLLAKSSSSFGRTIRRASVRFDLLKWGLIPHKCEDLPQAHQRQG